MEDRLNTGFLLAVAAGGQHLIRADEGMFLKRGGAVIRLEVIRIDGIGVLENTIKRHEVRGRANPA